jgi:hypothetical protein
VFSKTALTEIIDWSHVDYVCIKATAGALNTDIYYLDGHPIFETSLTAYDRSFIDFARSLEIYGNSEKMLGDSSNADRFYIRVNINNEQQESALIDHLCQGRVLSLEQKQLLCHLRGTGSIIEQSTGYRPLYFCGFSKERNLSSYNGTRFYFKTFGADESIRYDAKCVAYLEKCPIIKRDITFQVIRELVLTNRAGLRCIGVDFTGQSSMRLKYYLCEIPGGSNLSELLWDIKRYPQFTQNADALLTIMPDIEGFHCDLLQITGGCARGDERINMYVESQRNYQKKYYSLREGLVLRNIGGISFLIDICEKHYYDLKNLFSVNETGQVIIKYLMENRVCTLDGIVSYLRSIIVNYNAELYPVICSDCEMFINQLVTNGYVREVP